MPEQPTPDELKQFLEVFHKLDSFESANFVIRGHGMFKREELPIPAVVNTIAWLKHLARQEG